MLAPKWPVESGKYLRRGRAGDTWILLVGLESQIKVTKSRIIQTTGSNPRIKVVRTASNVPLSSYENRKGKPIELIGREGSFRPMTSLHPLFLSECLITDAHTNETSILGDRQFDGACRHGGPIAKILRFLNCVIDVDFAPVNGTNR